MYHCMSIKELFYPLLILHLFAVGSSSEVQTEEAKPSGMH